jgi:AcrR family transcriptional regulator
VAAQSPRSCCSRCSGCLRTRDNGRTPGPGSRRRSGRDGCKRAPRAVAERLEYSPSAIYGYFPTKDDLLAALAADGFRQLNDALTRVSEVTNSSPLARLREFYWRYYEFGKTHPAYYELLMFLDSSYAQDRWDREALELLHPATADADRLIAGCIATGTFLSEMSPTAVRRTLWAAVHGAAVIALRKRLPAESDRDRLAADTLDAVLAGCRAGAAPATRVDVRMTADSIQGSVG